MEDPKKITLREKLFSGKQNNQKGPILERSLSSYDPKVKKKKKKLHLQWQSQISCQTLSPDSHTGVLSMSKSKEGLGLYLFWIIRIKIVGYRNIPPILKQFCSFIRRKMQHTSCAFYKLLTPFQQQMPFKVCVDGFILIHPQSLTSLLQDQWQRN